MTLKTLDDVHAVVEALRTSDYDPESQHSTEDELWGAVLRAIADGSCPDPKAWALAAIETSEIDFPRWTA